MIYWNSEKTIPILKSVLEQNEVILASGDTVLGLWGQPTLQVLEKLNSIKQRNDKPYLLVVGSVDKLSLFTDQVFSERLKNLIGTCWPGAVTLIFKARHDLPSWLKGTDGTIAIRIPDHLGLLKLLKNFDALFSTSANIHGQPIPESVASVSHSIIKQVGAVCVQEGQLVYPQNPSTILNVSTGLIEVVREGVFDREKLQELLG
ncbi:L-threonylcarbamoyladenylate synthase [Candidatus Dependentiae bacterium]|nr:L-threonylcarbamoyladenylate synthase [Candidatus Dependentiae bacterium]